MSDLQKMFDDTSSHQFTKHTDITRARISTAIKKLTSTPEARALMSARAKEVNSRPEVKAKQSAALKGRVVSKETGAKLTASKLRWYQCPWGRYLGCKAAAKAGKVSVSYFEKKLKSDPSNFYKIKECQ
jgi:hypothetical protein